MTRAQRMFAEALIVVGVLGALWVAVGRTMVEQTNRTVALAVDWQEVRALAGAEGGCVSLWPCGGEGPDRADGDAFYGVGVDLPVVGCVRAERFGDEAGDVQR